MNGQQIDDKPQERESEVRHAHAVAASRHGRAATPGYLGLPAEEDPEGSGARSPDGGSQQGADRSRRGAGRARGRAAARSQSGRGSQPSGRSGRSRSEGDSQPKRGSQAKRTRRTAHEAGSTGSAKPSTTSETKRGARTGKTAQPARKGARPAGGASSKGRKATSGAGGRGASAARASGGGAKAAAASVTSKVASVGESGEKAVRQRARREAMRIGGSILKRALIAGSRAAAHALMRVGEKSADSLLDSVHRLPIQQSIDVAVPPEIAWQQWMELRHLPEGAHRLGDVERDGDQLHGHIARRGVDWSAEVIDEREQESFAWQSTEGSDSAGLATFHPLGERLTRVELTLDVQPEDVGEAALLLLHVADRRVREELRRFKADAELLNPDIYQELLESDEDQEIPDEDEDEDSEEQ